MKINLNQYELPWPWNKTVRIREWLEVKRMVRESFWLSVLAAGIIAVGCGAMILAVMW